MSKMQIIYAPRKLKEVSKLLRNFDRADKKRVTEIDAEVDHKIKIVRFGV